MTVHPIDVKALETLFADVSLFWARKMAVIQSADQGFK